MTAPVEKCRLCRFWLADPDTADPNDIDWGYGKCRLAPPVVVGQLIAMQAPRPRYGDHTDLDIHMTDVATASIWPATLALDWCGAYVAKPLQIEVHVDQPAKRAVEAPADPAILSAVLAGAFERLAMGGVASAPMRDCVCAHRDRTNSAISAPYPGPDGDGRPWCLFCAVEAEQITSGQPGDYYGHALAAVAAAAVGRSFALADWCDRDAALHEWADGKSAADILSIFERADA